MRVATLNKILICLFAAVVISVNSLSTAFAQSPTPATMGIMDLPEGDTTILMVAAAILVLIVLGGVLWQARMRK